jgi:hypothetical protein
MAIDVAFTGLMVICLYGQPNCPVNRSENTAWAVRASSDSLICGRESKERTTLAVTFDVGSFSYQPDPSVTCKPPDGQKMVICTIPNSVPAVNVEPDQLTMENHRDESLERVLRIDEVDWRFTELNEAYLQKGWVSTSINFPKATIAAGNSWRSENYPVKWYRSSEDLPGGKLPRYLSDTLVATYSNASEVKITTDREKQLLHLRLLPSASPGKGTIVFKNYADPAPQPDHNPNHYDNLGYLVWYYRLGTWATEDEQCPQNPVLLRCRNADGPRHCACRDSMCLEADPAYWPVVLGGRSF